MLQNTRALQTKLYQRGSLPPYSLAQTNALLGNTQQALQLLKIAYDRHDEAVIQIASDSDFTHLHDEPAYKDLVAKLGLPAGK